MVISYEIERPLGASASAWEFQEIPGLVLTSTPRDLPLLNYADGQPGPGWKFENWGNKRLAKDVMQYLEGYIFLSRHSAMDSLDSALRRLGYA